MKNSISGTVMNRPSVSTVLLLVAVLVSGCGSKDGGSTKESTFPISSQFGLQTKQSWCDSYNPAMTSAQCDGLFLDYFRLKLTDFYNKSIAATSICDGNLAFCSGDYDERLESHVKNWMVH